MAGEEGKSKPAGKSAMPMAKHPAKAVAKPIPVKLSRTRPIVAAPVLAKDGGDLHVSKSAAKAIVTKPVAAKPAALKTAVVKPRVAAPAKSEVALVEIAPAKVEPRAPIPIKTRKVRAAPPVAPVSETPIPAVPQPPLTQPPLSQLIAQKDKIMDMTSSYANSFQDVIADAQDKAKEAFEKSSTMFSEAGEFARGNVEAIVESSKVLASGLQDLGTSIAAESRSAFEMMTVDLKELAAAKTPADFLKIQSELIRKSFDGAVAYGSKNSEAVLKLATDAFAPISGRVSLAVEKARS